MKYSLLKPESIYKDSKEWLIKNQVFMYESRISKIDSYIKNEDLEKVNAGIIIDIGCVASWYDQMFIKKAFDGENDAFDYLLKSFQYSFLQTRLSISNIARYTYDNDYKIHSNTLIGLLPREKSLILCKGLALGYFKDSEKLGQIFLTSLIMDWFIGNFTNTKILPFIMQIYCSWANIEYKSHQNFEPLPEFYKVIIKTWKEKKSEVFEKALLDACDYHINESREDTNAKSYQFTDSIYRVFPVEILAVLQLRNNLGLGVPEINHELFKLPTAKLCLPDSKFKDELLEKVEQRAKFEFGNFFDPFTNEESLIKKVRLKSLID